MAASAHSRKKTAQKTLNKVAKMTENQPKIVKNREKAEKEGQERFWKHFDPILDEKSLPHKLKMAPQNRAKSDKVSIKHVFVIVFQCMFL